MKTITDEKNYCEIAKSIYDCMSDEQKAKAAECQTDEEFSAYMNSLELELPDDAAETVAGGIQAGDVMKHIRDEFILPPKPKPTTTLHDERLKRVL